MEQIRNVRPQWVMVTAVLLFWFLALSSLVDDSPTMDEQNHLARGVAFLRTGDPRLSLEHPPLVNTLSALPLLTMDVALPLDAPSWTQQQPPDVYWYVFAEQFMWQMGNDVGLMIFLARLPIVFLTMGLALVGYHFARALWGKTAALLASGFLLFDPNLLAHGRYTTTDVGGTAFMLLATFLLWRLWRAPGWNWRRWLWAPLGMGLAFAGKLSILAFVPIWAVMALLPLPRGNGSSVGQRLLQLLTAGLASVGVVWMVFAFEWGAFRFSSEWLAALNAYSGPMPTFWAGIEKILLLSGGGRASFLLGETSFTGFWYYFPVALAVKTPMPTLFLWGVTAVLLIITPAARRRALFLLVPALLYFALSLTSAINIGYRHLFPMLPFVYLLISGGVRAIEVRKWSMANGQLLIVNWPLTIGYYAGFVWLLLNTVTIHPHYLGFFNAVAGGPEHGHNVLIDSNIDWGQDLLRFKEWMAENGVDEVKLGWFGMADPDYYGIEYQPLPGFPRRPFYSRWTNPPFAPTNPQPGLYAISASSLWEPDLVQKNVYPWFRARLPDDRVGYSILIYRVP